MHLSAVEHGDGIVFLHAVQDGPASQSYGLQVAQLAGVPQPVIKAARKHLARLEAQALDATPQLDLFAAPDTPPGDEEQDDRQNDGQDRDAMRGAASPGQAALFEAVSDLDPDSLTPRAALDALYRLKALASAASQS